MKALAIDKYMENDSVKAEDIDNEFVQGYKSIYNRYAKRLIDFVMAIILVIVISPIYLVVSMAILIEDGLPIFYRADRGGYHGKKFRICKFRSMVKNADKIGGGTTAMHDKRITKVGTVIRKMKIDELPNLINIICGEMSFVGPRPELLKYTDKYKKTEKFILEVRPGITDYSSIEFINLDEIVGGDNADAIYEEKVLPRKNRLRVRYAATVSLWTDAKIIILTIYKVLEKSFAFIVKKEHR